MALLWPRCTSFVQFVSSRLVLFRFVSFRIVRFSAVVVALLLRSLYCRWGKYLRVCRFVRRFVRPSSALSGIVCIYRGSVMVSVSVSVSVAVAVAVSVSVSG